MALNQHPSSATAVSGSDKGELCTQKENAAIEEKEANQSSTQVIGSALQVIEQLMPILIFFYVLYISFECIIASYCYNFFSPYNLKLSIIIRQWSYLQRFNTKKS